jgi:hypothetical protein
VAFLVARGVDDFGFAGQIASQVGSNPLSLRLALDVLEKEGGDSKGFGWLKNRTPFFLRTADPLIQGQLYRRILHHVHDPAIAKLAHPGLVLRRVTPELIMDVLAEPCGVDVRNLDDAKRLLDEMEREVALVTRAEDGSLHHRPEVRQIMLSLLMNDEPQKVRDIQTSAVAFYALRPASDVAGRAEMLYHMLMLERPSDELEGAWRDAFTKYLGNALQDLPETSQTWLATHLGISVSASAAANVPLPEWERYALQRTRDVLRLGKPELALRVLAERNERTPGSELYLPQAQAQVMVRDLEGALGTVAQGLSEVVERLTQLKLYVVGSWADRLAVSTPPDDVVAEVSALQQQFGNDPRILRYALNRLTQMRLLRLEPSSDFRRWLLGASQEMTTTMLTLYPELTRDIAAAVGPDHPEVMLRLAPFIQFAPRRGGAAEEFFAVLHEWGTSSGIFERFNVDMSPTDVQATLRNLGLLAERGGVPESVFEALVKWLEEQGRSTPDQSLYQEIETDGPAMYAPA